MQSFISYAHADYQAFKSFKTHMNGVARGLNIDLWADERINGGNYWNAKIQSAISDSHCHILLMSPAFFDSDYILDHELPAIAEKCRNGCLTLPVLLDRCTWEYFVGVLQVMPKADNGQLLPIREWTPRDHGFHAAAKQIGTSLQDFFQIPAGKPFDWGQP